MPKRTRYAEFFEKVGDKKIRRIALDRAYSTGITINMLSKKYGYSTEQIRRILRHAIEHPTLITDAEANLIAHRSSLNQYPHTKVAELFSTKNYYVELLATRAQNQRALLEAAEKRLLEKIAELENILANYDNFVSSSDEQEFTREDLESDIANLRKELDSLS